MKGPLLNFEDAQLQTCYERNLTGDGNLSDGLQEMRALVATHDLFLMLEGPHSSRVHETINLLLSPELRPELRRWCQRSGVETDSATVVEFKNQLSQLAGERLDAPIASPGNPS